MAGPEFRLILKPIEKLMEERGLKPGGRVQKYVDGAVIRLCEPYVPFDTGALKESPYTCSPPGGGKVIYGVPYARKQYYENKGDGGLRGSHWFERMKADHLEEIVRGAAEIIDKEGK